MAIALSFISADNPFVVSDRSNLWKTEASAVKVERHPTQDFAHCRNNHNRQSAAFVHANEADSVLIVHVPIEDVANRKRFVRTLSIRLCGWRRRKVREL